MRKLLLFCGLLFAALNAGAQCAASLSSAASPLNNQLLRVQFTNSSSWGLPFAGQIRKADINFGDFTSAAIGTTSPSHVYSAPGTYTVGIRIYSIDSATQTVICTDTFTLTVVVGYGACGTIMGVSGSGLTRSFTATNPAGTPGMTYTWNFGDGSPTATGSPVSHTYAASGTYSVTLTATKSTTPTCSYVNVMPVTVYVPPAAINCTPLRARFSTSMANNVLTTTNTSSTISAPYKIDYKWYYGDGSTTTQANPLPHSYAATGIYAVSLVVTWHDSLYTTVCRDSVVDTVAVTYVPPSSNVISGTVYYDSVNYGINNFKVWLIKYDSATNWLYAVDSQITANTAFPFYSFANKAPGSYRTKAAVWIGSSSGYGIIPTYHDTSSYWNKARLINHAGGLTVNRHIYMNSGVLPGGPGFIGGNVSLGANKGTSGGVADMLIILRNQALNIVQATYTDANGNYSFPNIPTGNYSVYPEYMNFFTQPVTPVVVTTANPTAIAVNFNQDLNKKTIEPRGVGVGQTSKQVGFTLVPNPAENVVKISWKAGSEVSGQFILSDIRGAVVAQTATVKGAQGEIELNISQLPAGMYFVRGTGDLSVQVSRLIVR